MGTVEVWVRPRAARDGFAWDGWRRRWVVSCREPATEGKANEAILTLLAERLALPRTSLSLVTGAGTRAKVVEVAGLSDSEVDERLHCSQPAEK